jgi:chemotaxis protein methyltransferase CheR
VPSSNDAADDEDSRGRTAVRLVNAPAISSAEFALFQRFIFQKAGITLSSAKEALVGGRLARRLASCGVDTYKEYFHMLASGQHPDEVQTAIDLLTTNETRFFRESKHFDLLARLATEARGRTAGRFRVWSAACSTGEEPYSIAMVLADRLEGETWEVVGSDISTRVLERARIGHYPMERCADMPAHYLKRFCLKGLGRNQGTLLIERTLRSRVQFRQINLNHPVPALGMFDVIFLRNVMIYFNDETKREVVGRLLAALRPGGHFFIGHSESLHGIHGGLVTLAPSIYRKP